ncbi:MAG: carboxypeptidase-like regulatory domain-containing protein [Bacteroidales bacterium]|nr:carboxypeptidase-like regulatory domain-containing protein [Bacteroidales bacterium]MDD3988771.1 carboxypeptidase-like regulatory domain-containing protein [Bacteroidales bacterium]
MKKNKVLKFGKIISVSLLIINFTSLTLLSQNGVDNKDKAVLKGVVVDKSSGEPLAGVIIFIEGTHLATYSGFDGSYLLKGIVPGKHNFVISLISYKKVSVPEMEVKPGVNELNIVMEESSTLLGEVIVSSVQRMNSEIAVINAARRADVVVSGISGRQISMNQERNAAEVVRRIPGVSLTDDRYIMVRGLAGRYNNVWINNSAVPSTEADTRAFSFDMLPASQIESIIIVKSPSAELPSDFSGGFVKILTKGVSDKNETVLSWGMNYNSSTQFSDLKYNTPSSTDFLGFDNGQRGFKGDFPVRVNNSDAVSVSEITKNGFNNDWRVRTKNALPDQKLNLMISKYKKLISGDELSGSLAINYSNSSLSVNNMLNSHFGVYNSVEDKPEYLYSYTDNQYSIDSEAGIMLNLSWLTGDSRIEFRNTFNQHGKNRYTVREGWQNISARYNQQKHEYLYWARTTYTGQFSGTHKIGKQDVSWTAGYSYAGLDQPDRKIINREENLIYGDRYYGLMAIDQNEISRDFVTLKEHTVSAAANTSYSVDLSSSAKSGFKAGIYTEYRTRDYKNRQFFYRYNQINLPEDFVYGDPVSDILTNKNYSSDKLYIYEETDNRNSYVGANLLGAAYLSGKITAGDLNVIAGLRFEANLMQIRSYDRIFEFTTTLKNYGQIKLFPSLNASYSLNPKNLLRVAYGSSVNRHEFREVSSSVFYDFNLFSDVKGNPNLKNATIQNLDLRYEYYPNSGEYITLALFYKHFINPIEWTYLDAGGSYTYTFENALGANNLGAEADIRKNLEFIGAKNLTVGVNAAYIYSRVTFDSESSLQVDRPMQGQSPYLINFSLYYDLPRAGINAGLLYNRIGKRIVGIGRVDTGSGASINNDVPDTYELPRDLIDFVLTKKMGECTDLKLNIKDILNQNITFLQYPKFIGNDGKLHERTQTVKRFRPGTNIFLGINISF